MVFLPFENQTEGFFSQSNFVFSYCEKKTTASIITRGTFASAGLLTEEPGFKSRIHMGLADFNVIPNTSKFPGSVYMFAVLNRLIGCSRHAAVYTAETDSTHMKSHKGERFKVSLFIFPGGAHIFTDRKPQLGHRSFLKSKNMGIYTSIKLTTLTSLQTNRTHSYQSHMT